MSNPYRILVIDDDKSMRESLSHLLDKAGFEIECFSRADKVTQYLQTNDIDVLLSDVRMPGMNGLELLNELTSETDIPVVLMTAHGDVAMAVDAIQSGAYSFLEKPFDPRRLLKLLENAAQLRRVSLNERRLRERLADISRLDRVLIGSSKPLQKLRDEVIDLSTINTNVMLRGETGTGKELVARSLHDIGPRASSPFVVLNCAAIPVTKFEETLFGLSNTSPGLLRQAEGGTLFIDELGAVPKEIQPKLLRVIDTKHYSPVNSIEHVKADIRIISAGNNDLETMIKSGEFREDLYFRLNTVVVTLPSLRERQDDIILLYKHYLNSFASTYETSSPELSTNDFSELLAYDWPGNVRELINVCERHILASRRSNASVSQVLNQDDEIVKMPETLREAVATFERQLISKALVTHDGRMDDVAKTLGIGRRTLNEKIVKLGLQKDELLKA